MRRGIAVLACLIGIGSIGVAGAAAAAPPPNDGFADAQSLIGALPIHATGTTDGATRETGEPTPPGTTPSGHSIWFSWQAQSSEYVSVNTCGSRPRTILAVYTGTALGSLTEVASNRYSFAPDCRNGGSEVLFRAAAGAVYSISADGDGFEDPIDPASTGEGAIDLELEHPSPPANDDFADAETISTDNPDFSIDNFGATKEPGEPEHAGNPGGASVWFEWTAPRSGGAFLQACNAPIGKQPLVGVYTGSTVAALALVPAIEAPSPPCDYLFFAYAGVTYHLAYDAAYDAAASAAEMFENSGSLRYVPPNDDFEDASTLENPLTGAPDTEVLEVGPSNVGATKEPGEPDHAGDPGGASVWFEWTAPETGSVQMSACEAGFPTLLAVYTGSVLSQLTPVASGTQEPHQDCPLDSHATGEVGFDTYVGTTYDIAVDGAGGAWGRFNFDLWASSERLKAPRSVATKSPSPVAAETRPPSAKRPRTKIYARRIDQATRSATVRLSSDVSDVTFRCRLDGRSYRRCRGKVSFRHLASGRHTFKAIATGASGLADSTPAKWSFRIDAPPRRHPR